MIKISNSKFELPNIYEYEIKTIKNFDGFTKKYFIKFNYEFEDDEKLIISNISW